MKHTPAPFPKFQADFKKPAFFSSYAGFFSAVALCTSLYLISNHLQFFTSSEVPKIELDYWVPYNPWAFVPYVLFYLGPLIIFVLARSASLRRRFLYTFISNGTVQFFIYCFFPTHTLRHVDVPTLPAGQGGTAEHFLLPLLKQGIHFFDSPQNAFPSQHISINIIVFFFWLKLFNPENSFLSYLPAGLQSLLKFLGFLCAASIFWAVLATKQHYWIDTAGGTVLGLLSLKIGNRLSERSQ